MFLDFDILIDNLNEDNFELTVEKFNEKELLLKNLEFIDKVNIPNRLYLNGFSYEFALRFLKAINYKDLDPYELERGLWSYKIHNLIINEYPLRDNLKEKTKIKFNEKSKNVLNEYPLKD